ncbi:MAG: CoA transferase [Dehalococcoidia bacterium]
MPDLPLEDIRILDLSQVYAGPLASRVLADMGAEIIRIESAIRSTRGGASAQPGAVYPDGDPGERPYNRSAYYNELHRNKLAISLDLSREQGKEVFKQLVHISDIVLENFTPRVMVNFGLDYESLREANPSIIMVSISAYGQTGPYRNYISFGRGIEAMAGLSHITGYPDGPPLGPGTAYADATGGLHAAFAALMALRHRRQTGKGQHIDLSLRESLVALLGENIVGLSMNKRGPRAMGNQDDSALFQGCYRCKGRDKWVALAICSERELERLLRFLEERDLADREESINMLNLNRNRGELDRRIEKWTVTHEPGHAMRILQEAGIRAGSVMDAGELCSDPHLISRGFFHPLTHPEAGTFNHPGLPWKSSRFEFKSRISAPCFAQHNSYVLSDLLGFSGEHIRELENNGIISSRPIR